MDPLQSIHILNPGMHKCVMLHGKRNFADVIKVWDLKIREIILDYLGGSSIITWALKSREFSLAGIREMQQKWKSERFQVYEEFHVPLLILKYWELRARTGEKSLGAKGAAPSSQPSGKWDLILQPQGAEFCQQPDYT